MERDTEIKMKSKFYIICGNFDEASEWMKKDYGRFQVVKSSNK